MNAVKAIQLSDIKPGSYVGAAAMPGPDGKQTAKEVLVFPESRAGYRRRPLRLGSGRQQHDDECQRGYCGARHSGRDLKLSYKGGSNNHHRADQRSCRDDYSGDSCRVDDGQEGVRCGNSENGRHLDGKLVVVEKDGVAPPM